MGSLPGLTAGVVMTIKAHEEELTEEKNVEVVNENITRQRRVSGARG